MASQVVGGGGGGGGGGLPLPQHYNVNKWDGWEERVEVVKDKFHTSHARQFLSTYPKRLKEILMKQEMH